jgi:hypothetical protein
MQKKSKLVNPKKVKKSKPLKDEVVILPVKEDIILGGASKKTNNWLEHVKKYREKHPEISYKDALKKAAETYKKA